MFFHAVPELTMFLILSFYLAASAVCQLPGALSDRIRRYDVFNLIPAWSFFAPNPATHDLHLLVRDVLEDGSFSRWTELQPLRPHHLLSPVWNPGRRHTKAFFDIIKNFALIVKANPQAQEGIKLSLPYIAILNYVSGMPRHHEAIKTQFLVMRTERLLPGGSLQSEPSIVFFSSLHVLKATPV